MVDKPYKLKSTSMPKLRRKFRFEVEPCADVIISAAARWTIFIKKIGGGAAWAGKLSNFAYLFQ